MQTLYTMPGFEYNSIIPFALTVTYFFIIILNVQMP